MVDGIDSPAQGTRPATSFGVVLASLVVVELFSGVLQVYFTPLYPELAHKFAVSIGTLSWALTAWTLATVVFTPVFARLGDLYGHRRVLKLEATVVLVGCVLIAVAPNFPVLLVGRILQGTFAAYLPLMFGALRTDFTAEKLRSGVAYLTSILIFGVLLGTVVTGVIVESTSGPGWALWVPPLGTAIGLALLFTVPNESRGVRPDGAGVDWPGVTLLAAGLCLVVLALTEGPTWGWASARVVGLLVGGAVLLALWVWTALRTAHPLIDVRYLFRPHLVPVFVIGFCVYFGAIGGAVAIATLLGLPGHSLGYGFGLSAFHISLYYVPVYFCMFLTTSATARTGLAIGYRATMAVGCIMYTVGYGGLIFAHGSLAGFIVSLSFGAAGAGFIEGATRTIVVGSLRDGEVAIGEGVYELAITVGAAVGSAVVGGILAGNAVAHQAFATLHGYQQAYGAITIVGLVSIVVAIGFLLQGRREAPTSTEAAKRASI